MTRVDSIFCDGYCRKRFGLYRDDEKKFWSKRLVRRYVYFHRLVVCPYRPLHATTISIPIPSDLECH